MLDIEGTVAPISFVYEVMFPYAKKKLGAYLEQNWESAELQAEVLQVQAEVSCLMHFMLRAAVSQLHCNDRPTFACQCLTCYMNVLRRPTCHFIS